MQKEKLAMHKRNLIMYAVAICHSYGICYLFHSVVKCSRLIVGLFLKYGHIFINFTYLSCKRFSYETLEGHELHAFFRSTIIQQKVHIQSLLLVEQNILCHNNNVHNEHIYRLITNFNTR